MRALTATASAQLLFDVKPRPFYKREELKMPTNISHKELVDALSGHPVVEVARGHPGTLVSCPFVRGVIEFRYLGYARLSYKEMFDTTAALANLCQSARRFVRVMTCFAETVTQRFDSTGCVVLV